MGILEPAIEVGNVNLDEAIQLVLTPQRRASITETHRRFSAERNSWEAATAWAHSEHEIRRDLARTLRWKEGGEFSLRQLAEARPISSRSDLNWCSQGDRSLAAWDNCEFYRERGTPVAIIVHCYARDEFEAKRLAGRFGLLLKTLPFSWYVPNRTRAFMYLRSDGSVQP